MIKINLVVRNNRLPRICTAIIAGAGLGLAGCIFTGYFAESLHFRIDAWRFTKRASFGAAVADCCLWYGKYNGAGRTGVCAFVGSILVALTILGLSVSGIFLRKVVLSGVAISAMFTGATTRIQYFADEVQLATLVYWTFVAIWEARDGDDLGGNGKLL